MKPFFLLFICLSIFSMSFSQTSDCRKYPETSEIVMTPAELDDLMKRRETVENRNQVLHELWFMRNEIYADHGYIFTSADAKRIFGKISCYRQDNSNVTLTKVEQKNINNIKILEQEYK